MHTQLTMLLKSVWYAGIFVLTLIGVLNLNVEPEEEFFIFHGPQEASADTPSSSSSCVSECGGSCGSCGSSGSSEACGGGSDSACGQCCDCVSGGV